MGASPAQYVVPLVPSLLLWRCEERGVLFGSTSCRSHFEMVLTTASQNSKEACGPRNVWEPCAGCSTDLYPLAAVLSSSSTQISALVGRFLTPEENNLSRVDPLLVFFKQDKGET